MIDWLSVHISAKQAIYRAESHVYTLEFEINKFTIHITVQDRTGQDSTVVFILFY